MAEHPTTGAQDNTDTGAQEDNTASTATMQVIKISEKPLEFPRHFAPGMTLTSNQALCLDAFYGRQFANNQTANAKTATAAGKLVSTHAEMLALWQTYEPTVSGATRTSETETIRNEAAWRVFVARIADHNAKVASGADGTIGAFKGRAFTIPTGKGAPAWRENTIATVLAAPTYADRVAEQIALIQAERATKKGTKAPASATVSVAADDLL